MQETLVRSLGQKNGSSLGPPWRRAWQPTPVFLPGGSPWTEEPGGLQSMRSKESDMTELLSTAQHSAGLYVSPLLPFHCLPVSDSSIFLSLRPSDHPSSSSSLRRLRVRPPLLSLSHIFVCLFGYNYVSYNCFQGAGNSAQTDLHLQPAPW